ncbi:MAG: hypothetical protein KME11_07440 [Timaviella obliquedivisa GSE-PSE-MK23-08B]|jgi:hypothetical protein|nr:hypothetical protein [Timaviella obliquedivisa GSE-PSE-MK23-08B]
MNIQKSSGLGKIVSSSIKLFLILISTSLALSSCTNRDFKIAQALSEEAERLNELNENVSLDIYNSCVRSNNWLNRDTSQTGQNIRDGLEQCDQIYRSNSDRARIVGQLLVGYVEAIGELTVGREEEVQAKFESIGASLKELRVETGNSTLQFTDDTINTGVNIATFLTNLLLTDFRRRNIKVAVVCTDPDIQSYSMGFTSFIDEIYMQGQLDDEIDSITRYYLQTNLLSDVITQPLSPESAPELQNTQDRRNAELRDELLKVTDRKNTASTYINLIQATAATHANLKRIFNDGKDEISPEQTAKCNRYFAQDETKTNMKAVETDFPNQEMSQFELEQARKEVDAYIERVTPLLESLDLKPTH